MACVETLVHVPAFAPVVGSGGGLPLADAAIRALEAVRGAVPEGLGMLMFNAASKQLDAKGCAGELASVCSSWRSNGRLMSWARMVVEPGASFEVHCHPNVEVMYVLRGTLYERRLRGKPACRGPFLAGRAASMDFDLRGKTDADFETVSHTKGAVLANEIGSVHRSYAGDEQCEIFCLWGGCHAKVKFAPACMDTVTIKEEEHAILNNCSEWIANALADAGCTTVYGGHGGALVPLVNAVVEHPRLQWVCTRNEANASLMAAAESKLTGRLACVMATSGPGATNLTTGLMDALKDRLPVLAITGLKPRGQLHYAEFQDVDQSRLFAGGGIEFSCDVASPESLIPLLRDAVATASTRRTCAHLAVPVDVQAAPCPLPLKSFCAAHASERVRTGLIDPILVAAVARLVRSSSEHRVLVALGARAALTVAAQAQGSTNVFQDLAELLGAPVVTRLDAKGAMDERHDLAFGVVGVHGKPGLEHAAALIETAELVLAFGVDDHTLLVCNNAGLQVRAMVEFEPDALCVATRFRAVHTVVGDLGLAARFLATAVKEVDTTTEATKSQKDLAALVQETATDKTPVLINSRAQDAKKIWDSVHVHNKSRKRRRSKYTPRYLAVTQEQHMPHPGLLLAELSSALDDERPRPILCVDTGDVTLWTSLCYAHSGRTLTSEHLGTMGYALCAGIAALCCSPAPQRAVVVVGDGGFQMTCQELATYAQHRSKCTRLTVVVFDNALLGRVAFGFQGAKGCELQGPDYVALAKAYGGNSLLVDKAEDLKTAVRAAVDAPPGLFLLHVKIDPLLKADMATFVDSSITVMNSG